MKRRCPKDCIDWHEEISRAARFRHAEAHNQNRRDQNQWKDAMQLLEKSQKSIYIQKSGQKKNSIMGIPEKICNTIQQIFIKIIEGEEDAVPAGLLNVRMPVLEDNKLIRNIAYRTGNYALLAALYKNYKGPCECGLDIKNFENSAKKHTDGPIAQFNYKTGTMGVMKCKDALIKEGLIHVAKGMNGAHFHSLTQTGARACFHLFNKKFHPDHGDYEAVTAKFGTVTEDGNYHIQGSGTSGSSSSSSSSSNNVRTGSSSSVQGSGRRGISIARGSNDVDINTNHSTNSNRNNNNNAKNNSSRKLNHNTNNDNNNHNKNYNHNNINNHTNDNDNNHNNDYDNNHNNDYKNNHNNDYENNHNNDYEDDDGEWEAIPDELLGAHLSAYIHA
jgi:hypothetical protein